jgi:hypothetical protein
MTILNWFTRNWLSAILFLLVAIMLLKKGFEEMSFGLPPLAVIAIVMIIVGQLVAHYSRLRFVGWVVTVLGAGIAVLALISFLPTFSIPGFPTFNIQEEVQKLNPWIRVGGVVILLGLLVSYKFKQLGGLLLILGAGFLLLAFFFPSIGTVTDRTIGRIEACSVNNDCGPRASDIPHINGGSVDIPRGGQKSFYASGKVALLNKIGYCLDVSPRGVFDLTWIQNGRRYYIESFDGTTQFVTVTSLPGNECPH